MLKLRKKSVEIETRPTRAQMDDVIASHNRQNAPPYLTIVTPKGEMRAEDWIIQGVFRSDL